MIYRLLPGSCRLCPHIDRKMHEEEGARGMGMFLIESLVDEVEWVSSPRSGSYARMVIRLHPDQEAEAIVLEPNDGERKG